MILKAEAPNVRNSYLDRSSKAAEVRGHPVSLMVIRNH